ncbi:MAG: immunoglobulin domain-containing protein [Verrucomicrobia bacterium]|nr:immunoglobulin domain-containing protein [Verrucomicrobiota bacterium]
MIRILGGLIVALLALASPLSGADATVLVLDDFDANTSNVNDLNTDIARQTGTLAPITYTMAGGPGNYGHQLQNGSALNQLLLADGVQSISSPDYDFSGASSINGLRISFDVDAMPSVYGGTSDHWGCINLGLSQADQMAFVNAGVPHFGILFRGAGTIQAFDGGTVVSPSPEPVYSTTGPGTWSHIELRITDEDGNPFDGAGNTTIEVFSNGAATPLFTFTKTGGYAHNYINLIGEFRSHFDNFEIAQLPEPPPPTIVNPSFEADTFAVWPGYVNGNGPITGWTSAGGHGINPAGGSAPFGDNGAVPDGAQIAFMQEDGALSQLLNGFVAGRTYQIRYFENARSGATRPFLAVTIDGATIVAAHEVAQVGGSNPYREVVSDPFVATAASMTLAFVKSNPQGGDTTALIDNIGFLASGTPPRILTQPQSVVAGLGETATFSVGAVGSAPLSYQWSFKGNPLPGETASTLSFTVASAAQAGDYRVTVSNAAGSEDSQPATLSVRALVPGLFNTGVDDSKAVLPDGSVDSHYTLIVNADSASTDAIVQDGSVFPIVDGPWMRNNDTSKWIGPRFNTAEAAALVSGNGEYVYRLTFDLTGLDLGTVVITGGWAIDNAGLAIRVNGIDTGLVNNNGFAGLTAFTIDSSNASLIEGLNTLDFVVQNTDALLGYTGLRVGNLRGLAALPGTPPAITTQPQGGLAGTGQTVTFSVAAEGSSPLSYQWHKDGAVLPGANASTLTLANVTRGDAGTYTVEVSNPAGTAVSEPAVLTVRDTVPGVLNTGVDDTGVAVLDGSVDGHYRLVVNPDAASADAIVQDGSVFPIVDGTWLRNNDRSKWIGPRFETSAAAGGNYLYRVTFDLTGFDPATVAIAGDWTCDNPGLEIYLNGQPTGNSHDGAFSTLRPFAVTSGFAVGINTLDFEVNNASLGYTGLRVANVLALGDRLPEGTAPFILEQPASIVGTVTETVGFSVRANGSAPLSYQWYYGPDPLPGETGPALSFLIEFPDQAGEYSVRVSNAFGTAVSDAATLIVSELPTITQQPQSAFVAFGDDVTFTVGALGTPPLEYQWMYEGQDIGGASANALTLLGVFVEDSGAYSVRVSNFSGSVTSAPAMLTVAELVPGFYNTGVDDAGAALPDGAADTHYALILNPDSDTATPLVEDSTVFPIVAGPWVANTPESKWIGPRFDTVAAAGAVGAGGDYVYRVVFDLTGWDATTARVMGDWATDNEGVDILVNGASTGQKNLNQFSTLTPFAIDSGLKPGLNTVDFRLNNSAVGYTGLRIQNLRGLAARLPDGTLPFLVEQPVGVTVDQGQTVTLSALANGSAPLSYQWFLGPNPIPGATGLVLSFVANSIDQSGEYTVLVTNPAGSTRSDPALVTVVGLPNQPPSFTPGPDVTVPEDAGPQTIAAWATDIQAGPPFESTQTLMFQVGVDNPGLFAEAPAISPEGTLTFTPAPGLCGAAAVTVMLKDDGGTSNGGRDESDPATFTITVEAANDCPEPVDQTVVVAGGSSVPITLAANDPDLEGCGPPQSLRFWVIPPSHGQIRGVLPALTYTPAPGYCGADQILFLVDDGFCFNRGVISLEVQGGNQCPVAQAQTVSTCAGTPVAITLAGTDPDTGECGAPLQGFAIAQGPAHGTLTGTAPDVTYTPAQGYSGPDQFTFTVTDGECVSAPAVVAITVHPVSQAPACQIALGPLLKLTPEQPEAMVLSCDNQAAEVVLDATLCTGADGGALTYLWMVNGAPVGAEAILAVTLELGTHEITLVVENTTPGSGPCDSGNRTSTCQTWVTVTDGCEAVDNLRLLLAQSRVHKSLAATLARHLDEAAQKFACGKCAEGVEQLEAFQDKVRHYSEYYLGPEGGKPRAKRLIDALTAERLIAAAQAIIDAYASCDCMSP